MKTLFIFFVIIAISIIVGCANIRMTHLWKDPTYQYKMFNKILVVGINGDSKYYGKEKMESEIANDLNNIGINAIAASQNYSPRVFRDIKEDSIFSKLHDSTIDAILTIVLLNKEKESRYVPNAIYYSPYVYYHRHFMGYYNTMYWRVYSPGYYTEDTKYFFESNMYDLKNKELIFSMQSSSFNPSSVSILAHQYSKNVIKNLQESGIIK